jgi:FkbM family methyltransferase
VTSPPSPLLREAFGGLAGDGLGVVDVGSRHGVHPMFAEIAPLVDAVGFEPDGDECRRLNGDRAATPPYRSLTFLPFGLGNEDGHRSLHLCRSPGTSSLLAPNRAFLDRFPEPGRFEVERVVSVPVRALDGLASDPTLRLPARIDFVKVDTQGSELGVLRGAPKTLAEHVVAVEVEVEFAPLYRSAVPFRDIDAYLSECGFVLFKLRRHEWVRGTFAARPERSAGQLVFGDALYLRDPLDGAAGWAPRDRHQAEALVLLAALYDLHDFAWEIVAAPAVAPLVDGVAIRRYITDRCRRLGPRWSGRRTIREVAGAIRTAARRVARFKRYPPTWARGDTAFYSKLGAQ